MSVRINFVGATSQVQLLGSQSPNSAHGPVRFLFDGFNRVAFSCNFSSSGMAGSTSKGAWSSCSNVLSLVLMGHAMDHEQFLFRTLIFLR